MYLALLRNQPATTVQNVVIVILYIAPQHVDALGLWLDWWGPSKVKPCFFGVSHLSQ